MPPSLRLKDSFHLDDEVQIVDVRLPDGTVSSAAGIAADTNQWATHFAHGVFNNHCTSHEHDCTETCIKYAKKKLEANQSLRTKKVPSCHFWCFCVVTIQGKRRRRRGKPLVVEPCIADTGERNQEFVPGSPGAAIQKYPVFHDMRSDCISPWHLASADAQAVSMTPCLRR